jgi:DNA-3-methyladenine glycosylase II
MITTFSEQNFHTICDELGTLDADLDVILKEHGYPPMWTRPNLFETLVHFILEQQVSLASALAALNKLKEKTGDLTPANLLKLSDEEMRACYVSRQKMGYIRGMAEAIKNNELDLAALETLSDDKVREKLIALKGIGNWTADVYLMFVLRKTDIYPIGDIAAVNALKRAKRLPKDADKTLVLEIAEQWKPYRTVATMILWHHYLSAPIKRSLS